ncbi:hypothetical protein MKI84_08520 [Ancylobacter sp. A5.8]|uniref:hypothetical protein n=1 Tax=Ancylobacter gelatini TaxID=2919920 RepID=UPI001F4EC13C|nr:hypothetical protein [Ancylobacter gelatini]MCJ8142959.1 hypothetical protein [Ancylobacter gelatini]
MTRATPPATRTIEVFRPGTHVTMGGEAITFSAEDLRQLAANYDADGSPAPVVVGHPSVDAPAYAWARSFSYDDQAERLTAEIGDIAPAFAEAVQAKRYRKVSLAFFRPTEAANPKPGSWYPRHVGFLGGAAPAVTGLKTVSFAGVADPVTVEFGGARESAGLFRRMREFLIEKFGAEDADRVLPDYEIRWLDDLDTPPALPAPAPAYAAPPVKDPTMSHPTAPAPNPPAPQPPVDFAARESQLAAREKAIADAERAALHGANVAFAAELAQAGRVLPAQQGRLVAALDALAGGSNAPVSFAAGEAAVAPVEALKTILRELPKVVPLGGTLPNGDAPAAEPTFAAPDGLAVDSDRSATHAKALAYQRQHPGTAYIDAVRAVDPRA